MRLNCVLCALLGALVAMLLFGPAPHADAQSKGQVSFIHDVAPILKENCFACHDAKKKKGKLDLTTYEALRRGGSKDDPIVVGKSRESLLVEVLELDGAGRMPPREVGGPLPKEKIALIARWIDQGAKLDKELDPKADLLRELRLRWKAPAPPPAYKFPALINALAFTPDGSTLVVGGNHELTVWETASGKLLRRIFTRAERAHAMVFLPDGKLAVAGGRPGQEGDVRLYRLDAGKVFDHGGVPSVDGTRDPEVLVKELHSTDDSVFALAVSADGTKLAAAGCDRVLRVWDLASGKGDPPIENHADWVLGLAFLPDGNSIASASRDKTAKVWDFTLKESVATFPDHQNTVTSVAAMPDGKMVLSTGEDGQLRLWHATDATKQLGKQAKTFGQGQPLYRLATASAGKAQLAATAGADQTVKLWDVSGGSAGPLKTLSGFGDRVFAVAISADGKLFAGGAANGQVRIARVADGAEVVSFNASPGYTAPAPMAGKK